MLRFFHKFCQISMISKNSQVLCGIMQKTMQLADKNRIKRTRQKMSWCSAGVLFLMPVVHGILSVSSCFRHVENANYCTLYECRPAHACAGIVGLLFRPVFRLMISVTVYSSGFSSLADDSLFLQIGFFPFLLQMIPVNGKCLF